MGAVHILVVEDTDDSRELLVDFLSTCGYSVDAASNGQQALAAAEKRRPDLVLLDLMMPIMDGWQFCAAARLRPGLSDLPIVVISAVEKPKLPAGVLGFVAKPVDLDLLEAQIKRVLNN